MLSHIAELVDRFFRSLPGSGIEIYNECALQHELGFWLRTNLPAGSRVQFERPAHHFFPTARGLVKKEIDLVVTSPDGREHYATELKCPRQGQHPEQMFKAWQDVEFLEQLVGTGFHGGIFAIHVDSPLFDAQGSQAGLYAHFRAGVPATRPLQKPTGLRDQTATLLGSYVGSWQPWVDERFWIQEVWPPTAARLPEGARHSTMEASA
jgi:hypothetical protein